MASRNRLLNGPVGEKEIVPKQYKGVAYNKKTGETVVFLDRDKKFEALESGEYVDTPAKCDARPVVKTEKPLEKCPFWCEGKCQVLGVIKEEPKPEPEGPKTLRARAKELGITVPFGATKEVMEDLIKKAENDNNKNAGN